MLATKSHWLFRLSNNNTYLSIGLWPNFISISLSACSFSVSFLLFLSKKILPITVDKNKPSFAKDSISESSLILPLKLSKAAGHFSGTGDFGKGNYCIAGHSSTIYKEYFNSLKNAEFGMKVNLYDKNKKCYTYIVKEVKIIEPDETWILDDFGDDRLTIVTCTDDGTQRLVVVAILSQ